MHLCDVSCVRTKEADGVFLLFKSGLLLTFLLHLRFTPLIIKAYQFLTISVRHRHISRQTNTHHIPERRKTVWYN